MSGDPLQLKPGVWALLVTDASRLSATVPDDMADAQGLPGWRSREFLAGRTTLRRLLADVLPEARDAVVAYADGGRPYLVDWPEVGISVAHDGDTVAAGVAIGHAIGVDVQHGGEEVSDSLLRRCLRDRAGELAQLPMRRRAIEFAWVWTAQEACVKAAGTGLAGRPWSLDVPPYVRRGWWGDYRWVSLRDASPTPFSCAFGCFPGRVP